MKNEFGFGLVQGLIVAAISAGLLLVLNSQQQLFKKAERTTDFTEKLNDTVEYVEKLLTNPYICSATVHQVTPATLAQLNTTIGDIPQIRQSSPNPNYNPEVPTSGTFYVQGGASIIAAGDAIRDGLMIQNFKVITAGGVDFIRMTIQPDERYKKDHLGGQQIIKDFLISTKKTAGAITECNRNYQSAHIREACLALMGTWDPVTSSCSMDELIDKRTLTKVWVQEGKVNLYPFISDEYNYGTVACTCNSKRCRRASMPCTCTLPTCSSKYSQCSDGSCIYSNYYNYDRTQSLWDKACMWAAYCKKLPPTTRFLIPPRPAP